ncbi:MAG: hypothetical protein ACTH31_16530, partial [Pseudoclavibacter sp.]
GAAFFTEPGGAAGLYDAFEPDRCERALPILRVAARWVDAEHCADVYASISWLHWALGHGTLAVGWAERALERSPHSTLADEVRQLVDHGVMAPWFGKPPRRFRATSDETPAGADAPANSRADAA